MAAADGMVDPVDHSETRRSVEVLTVEVDALHAWLCAVVVAIAADRRTAGLPDLPGLPVLPGDPEGAGTECPGPARAARRRRIEALGLRAV